MPTVNIGKRMKEEAFLQRGKRQKINQFNVSKNAVNELQRYINDVIDPIMAVACETAQKNKRKTVMESDIIEATGRADIVTIGGVD